MPNSTNLLCFLTREVATRADAALPEDSCLDPSVYIACDNLLLPARTLECDRLRVHRNLVVSLVIRFLVMLILTEPFISHRHTNTYRDVDWLCKLLLALRLYAQISSVNWMFVEGLFLHSRLTSNVFDSGAPFFIYYCIGWGWPMVLLVAWTTTMILHHHAPCWQGYSALKYVWILVAPMITVLMINLVFLVNIVRILVTKLQASDTQVRKAIKATAVLFPLLGITNLLFAVNPGGKGDLEGAYMLTNALFQSSQGVFVSVLYCFLNGEVQELVQKKWQQYRLQQLDKPGGPHRRSTRGTIIFEPSLSLRMSPNTSTSLQISPQTPTSQPLSPQSLSFQPVNIQTFNLQTLNHIYEVHQSGPLISRLLPSSEQCTQVHTYTEHDLMISSV
nr:corticotropin-releasing factor receptor 1-like [Cherax quadricarinatus]